MILAPTCHKGGSELEVRSNEEIFAMSRHYFRSRGADEVCNAADTVNIRIYPGRRGTLSSSRSGDNVRQEATAPLCATRQGAAQAGHWRSASDSYTLKQAASQATENVVVTHLDHQ